MSGRCLEDFSNVLNMPAKPSLAYQPFLLRILHGFTGLFVIAGILTAINGIQAPP